MQNGVARTQNLTGLSSRTWSMGLLEWLDIKGGIPGTEETTEEEASISEYKLWSY